MVLFELHPCCALPKCEGKTLIRGHRNVDAGQGTLLLGKVLLVVWILLMFATAVPLRDGVIMLIKQIHVTCYYYLEKRQVDCQRNHYNQTRTLHAPETAQITIRVIASCDEYKQQSPCSLVYLTRLKPFLQNIKLPDPHTVNEGTSRWVEGGYKGNITYE